MSDIKYPNITVRLVGQNGNAYVVMGLVQGALKKGGVPKDEIDAVMKEMMSGDYDHLLQVAMRTVNVE
jgi:hypothetical protein